MPSVACEESRIRSTIFSPNSVGQVLTRKSMERVLDSRILMRPSCGTRRSAMSRRDMTFRRALILPASCTGGWAISFRMPSMRRRTRNIFSYGSKWMSEAPRRMASSMHLVDEAHDRRVFDVVAGNVRAGVFVAAADFQRIQVPDVIVAEVRHRRVDLLHRLVEEFLQLVVFDDDRIDRHAGLELDLVDGVHVGRIGDAQEQALAALEQRQHPVLGQQLVGHRLDDVQVHAQRGQIEQWDAVFDRGRIGDLAGRGGSGGDQLGHKAGALLDRGGERGAHAGLVDHAVLDQALRQAAQTAAVRSHG